MEVEMEENKQIQIEFDTKSYEEYAFFMEEVMNTIKSNAMKNNEEKEEKDD